MSPFLAIPDCAAWDVRRCDGEGIIGQTEDVNVDISESVPELGLDERLKC